ncbi:CrcB family protein [Bifidobacterium sp. 82T24]|uniref:fluoride efflux transporter FluC n=1 Tax=Bifidobacterium pluvialisilvae TaxID=2834436 RepID=UPI001C583795|nr:CrcB family protein [Bifidobacterium pluvialisilvae]MBW3088562.1 CrcB family protein [Bifidobacterium pluvialisilvae]
MAEFQQRAAGAGPAASKPSSDVPPLADSTLYLVVFLGGCLGTGMRYGLSLTNAATAGDPDAGGVWSAIHLGTFTANIMACFVYAALSAYMTHATWIRKRSRDVISRGFGMGMCGGLSTMSTLAFEQFGDLAAGNVLGVLIYVVLSFGIGIMAAYLGVRLALAIAGRQSRRDVDAGNASPSASPVADTAGLPPSIAAKMDVPAGPSSFGTSSFDEGTKAASSASSSAKAAPSTTSANVDNPRSLWTDDDTTANAREARR